MPDSYSHANATEPGYFDPELPDSIYCGWDHEEYWRYDEENFEIVCSICKTQIKG